MTIDARGRRAGLEVRNAIDEMADADPSRDALAQFRSFQRRQVRTRQIGSGLVAAVIAVAAILLVARTLTPQEPTQPALPARDGRILFGEWDPDLQRADWFTARPDGSSMLDLHLSSTCAVWSPDGSRILVTNDAAVGPGKPLRPATVAPDGSDLQLLDAAGNPNLNLGCGDISPDGERIALEGFGRKGHSELDGIYSIRASDGGDLERLVLGPVAPPRYSPDGALLAFVDTSKPGVSPTGAGALFVTEADGSADPVRITPWGFAFDDPAWSPDGNWIVFQRPYGQLYLVRPDGSDIHRVPVVMPPGTGALDPSFSPGGDWIVFSLQREDDSAIYMARRDGSQLQEVGVSVDGDFQHPDWVPSTQP